MRPDPRPLTLLLALGLAAPAQVPLFVDGPPFGGARVFSEGLAPLANSARFDRARNGFYLAWAEGDQGADGALKALDRLDQAASLARGLQDLAKAPWALRTRAYGMSWVESGVHTSLAREERTGLLAAVDVDPAHVGSGIGLNATRFDLRRAVVDRLSIGAGATERGSGYGLLLRVERWKTGQAVAMINPLPGTLLMPEDPLGFAETRDTTTVATVDFGYLVEVWRGARLGVTVDRAIPHRFGDVKEQPQVRAGGQLDLGERFTFSVESDLNRAARMPFPLKQRVTSASLRMEAGTATTLILGAERQSLAGDPVIRGGLTVWFHAERWSVGLGLQASQERPLKGLALRSN